MVQKVKIVDFRFSLTTVRIPDPKHWIESSFLYWPYRFRQVKENSFYTNIRVKLMRQNISQKHLDFLGLKFKPFSCNQE